MKKYIKQNKVTIHTNVTIDEIVGVNGSVDKVLTTNSSSGEKKEFKTDGVFVFVGLMPNSQFLAGSDVALDDMGFVKTGEHMQTSMPGVFAAGDIRSGSTMQIASAVGEGSTAALIIREYLDGKLMPKSESSREVKAPQ
jgi:thioredoxin reductase (NADPH)